MSAWSIVADDVSVPRPPDRLDTRLMAHKTLDRKTMRRSSAGQCFQPRAKRFQLSKHAQTPAYQIKRPLVRPSSDMRAVREPDVVGKDELVLAAGRVLVGRFRCSLTHPLFHDSGPIQNFLVVFPRNAVEITHAGAQPIVSDPTRAMLYNRGQEYRRAPISPDGDRCDWFAFQRADVVEAVAAASCKGPRSEDCPLSVAQAPVDAKLYLRQRRVFEEASSLSPDPLRVEEGALLILDRTVRGALRFAGAAPDRDLDRS